MFSGPRFHRRTLSIAVFVACVAAVSLHAQSNPVSVTARVASAGKLKPGATLAIDVVMAIEPGWHVYGLTQEPPPIATRIEVAKGQPFAVAGTVDGPSPTNAHDANFDMEVAYYSGTPTFHVPIKASGATPGRHTLRVQVFFQACNDRFCLPPRTVDADVDVTVAAGGPGSDTGAMTAPEAGISAPASATTTARAQAAAPTSLLSFIWLAMTLGALSLLTPCVFPMVPITVSFFTKNAAGRKARAVSSALVYSVGIVLTFTALGMAMALLVGATSLNRFAASPWINILISAIFVGFALNLFGAYEITVPSRLLSRADAASRRREGTGVVPTLLMGFTFTLTSFTCTAPFVGGLLVMASQGAWQWPLVGMLAFSTVFALPFFVLALVPQIVAQLPRAGGWLNAVKVMMGFLELAAAMKFISNIDLVWGWGIFTKDVVLASWVAIGLAMAMYALGLFRLPHDSPVERVGAGRLVTALACLTVTFWLLTGLFGHRLGELEAFLPPATDGSIAASTMSGGPAASGELTWIVNDYEAALSEGRRQERLVFVDFTGYTCTNCRWMEANMFSRADVRQALERFVRVRLYTDGSGEVFQKQQALQQAKFDTVALPYYALIDADGQAVATFPGLTRDAGAFIDFLKKGEGRTAGRHPRS